MSSDAAARLRAGLDADLDAVTNGGCWCGDGPRRPDCADRIHAEVEVKRAILAEYERQVAAGYEISGDQHAEASLYTLEQVITDLASVYPDPDEDDPDCE